MTEKQNVIFTEDELNMLFGNEIQRQIFVKGMNRLFKWMGSNYVNINYPNAVFIETKDSTNE